MCCKASRRNRRSIAVLLKWGGGGGGWLGGERNAIVVWVGFEAGKGVGTQKKEGVCLIPKSGCLGDEQGGPHANVMSTWRFDYGECRAQPIRGDTSSGRDSILSNTSFPPPILATFWVMNGDVASGLEETISTFMGRIFLEGKK
ncbi:hypothetical protein CDAR_309781 [Caerostris darwini]|uniref:Uncharacterized protein n=1 Tax=Caerostris darwini TaxID=1538125 RepID=A0AAV4VYS9_9ARAC|nr:hypothetical protein CDAR_309781 [Caerostris darwini]